jgi:hypothetical protein
MLVFLQIWGGLFFLLNKIFLSRAERTEKKYPQKKHLWRILSWIVGLIGIPAWIVIFIWERNWIAFALELGGLPGMVLALVIAVRGIGKEPRWLHYVAIFAIIFGLAYSLYDFNGLNTLTQFAELALAAGFLIGTYQIARKKLSGYLWYVIMHLACILLMYLENYPWLVTQQIISIGFVIDAYQVKKSK